MPGIPTTKDTNGNPVVDSHALGRSAGTTAQNWAGPTMSGANSSLSNSSGVAAPGNPTPSDKTPGRLAAAQPGGHNATVLVPGGEYNTNDQIQTVAPLAGTAGGGASYPNIGAGGVQNPMVKSGWRVQSATGDLEAELDISGPEFVSGAHATTIANLATFTAVGGTGTGYTWSVAGSLPTGVSQSNGVLSAANTTSAGTAAFQVNVTDSGPTRRSTTSS